MVQENLKGIEYFSLGITLNDIPESVEPHSYDGGAMQREFLDFEVSTERLTVVADKMPGYGCTECGVKLWHPGVAIQALVRSARILSRWGDRIEARRLVKEARLLKTSP